VAALSAISGETTPRDLIGSDWITWCREDFRRAIFTDGRPHASRHVSRDPRNHLPRLSRQRCRALVVSM